MKFIEDNGKSILGDFSWNTKYQYKKYERTTTDNGQRTYNVEGKKIPSVTTILSSTKPKEAQDSLQKWKDRVGAEEAKKITQAAALRGTEMHYVIEQYMNGVGYLNLTPQGDLSRRMAHVIIKNLEPLKVIYGNEVSLAYKNLYAGATDLVGEHSGEPTIIDFKQANKPKRAEWIEDYFYQIAAYALAHEDNFGPINKGVICMCTKDLYYQQFDMDKSMLDEYKDKWLKKVDQYFKSNS